MLKSIRKRWLILAIISATLIIAAVLIYAAHSLLKLDIADAVWSEQNPYDGIWMFEEAQIGDARLYASLQTYERLRLNINGYDARIFGIQYDGPLWSPLNVCLTDDGLNLAIAPTLADNYCSQSTEDKLILKFVALSDTRLACTNCSDYFLPKFWVNYKNF